MEMCIPIDSTIKPTMEQIQSSRPFRAKSLRLRLRRLRSLRWFHLLQIPWPTEFEAAKMVAITCSSGGPHLRASDLHMDWRLYILYIYIYIYIYICILLYISLQQSLRNLRIDRLSLGPTCQRSTMLKTRNNFRCRMAADSVVP